MIESGILREGDRVELIRGARNQTRRD
jgi:hypothetical protein